MFEHFENFKSVTISLQKPACYSMKLAPFFYEVCNDYTEMGFYLHSSAPIVKSPKFESGVLKVLSNNELMLDEEEKRAICRLQNDSFDIQPSTDDIPVSYFEEINNKRRKKQANAVTCIVTSFQQFLLVLNLFLALLVGY